MIEQPLRFEPFFRPMIWGGRRLARFLGKNLPTADRCGESWEVSDHPLHHSSLACANGCGTTLRQLMNRHRRTLLGAAADRFTLFPWLVKFLDADDWLSVQVHPDDAAVQTLWPGESAKTEAWHILDATAQSRIYAGLKPGVGPRELLLALERGNVVDCLHAFSPRPGDTVYLPAGTVHALGGGILLAEIQQTSDATFRLFDWNRAGSDGKPRPLHLDAAFASIHWDQGPIDPIPAPTDGGRTTLVSCPYFAIEHVRAATALPLGGSGQMQALIVLEGQGRFANGEFVMPGDVWILPAALPATVLPLETAFTGLLCTLPK